jgi:hypothetical protein
LSASGDFFFAVTSLAYCHEFILAFNTASLFYLDHSSWSIAMGGRIDPEKVTRFGRWDRSISGKENSERSNVRSGKEFHETRYNPLRYATRWAIVLHNG